MPNNRLNDRQKRIIRTFSNGLCDKPDKTEWSYNTISSDDNACDLAVDINSGITAVDEIKDIHKSDLKLFERIGLITSIDDRMAFRLIVPMIHRLAR